MGIAIPRTQARRNLVLVADDEPQVQAVVVRVVHRLGLVALPVGDGAAAVATAAAHADKLLCAILDIQMPIMNGADAAYAIQQQLPSLALILISGAFPAHYAERMSQLRLVAMLYKPFRLDALHILVRDIAMKNSTPHMG